jgi:FixJ family two-component response regulator
MPTKRKVIAVIDDDFGMRRALIRLLSALGYNAELYGSARAFLDAAAKTEAICLMVDIELGESCGIELVRHLAKAGSTTPIIFMTADDNEFVKRRAREVGCVAFLRKPFSVEVLSEALTRISPRL